jgi:hypothetical protein
MTLDGKSLRKAALGAVLAGAALMTPSAAQAEEVSPTGKGIAGGALLGGEIVVFGEAIFGVHSGLAYIIGAVVGAGGGGVGGYFIEKASDDGRVPAYLLAAGVAGIIPAVVVTLDATRYRPTEGAREDKPTTETAPSDPGQPGGSSVVGAPPSAPTTAPPATSAPPASTTPPATPPPATPAPAPAGGGGGGTQIQARRSNSLVGVQQGQLQIGVPVPEVRPLLGSAERTRMGVSNTGSELRFPVVNIAF